MNNYNILWLDDVSKEEEIKDAIELFPNVSIKYFPFIDLCAKELEEHPERYDAVIFDANNQNSSSPGSPQTATRMGFLPLVKNTLEKRIPVYVCSGQLKIDYQEGDETLEMLYEMGLRKKENIFSNNVTVDELFQKIIDDLEANNNLYIGFDYLLEIFRKKWVARKYKTENLDPIMKYYKDEDTDSAHGNQMRKLIEQMLECVNSVLNITNEKKDRASAIINGLAHRYSRYSVTMIGALKHMDEMPNEESHNALDEDTRKLFFRSDFSTFFLVAKWFYDLMIRFEKEGLMKSTEQLDEIVEKTDTIPHNNPKKPEPENKYDGLYVTPYREPDGKTYVDIMKVRVVYGDKTLENKPGEVFVTGIRINKDKNNNPNGWRTWPVDTIKETENIQSDAPKSSGFKLGDIAKIIKKK